MQLKQLTAFHAVAQLKSFSEAVTVTQMSQPTLSRLIRQLEEDLCVELIDRYHRPLQLTAAGEFFFNRIESILKDLQSTVKLTQKLANPPDTLNIGFVPSVLYGLLPTIIADLKQRLPNIEVHLQDIPSFQQVNALKAGTIDVGFGRFAHDDAAIKQLLLRHERYVVALSKAHPLSQASELSLTQLQTDKVILYHQTHLPISHSHTEHSHTDEKANNKQKVDRFTKETLLFNNTASGADNRSTQTTHSSTGISFANSTCDVISEPLLYLFAKQSALPYITTTVSDIQVALSLVAAGEGLTLVPDSLKTVRSEQIQYVPLIHEDATSPIYLYSLKSPIHPAFTTLLEVIYEIYEERGITYRRKR